MDEDKLGSIDFPEFIEMLFFLEKRSRSKSKRGEAGAQEGGTVEVESTEGKLTELGDDNSL